MKWVLVVVGVVVVLVGVCAVVGVLLPKGHVASRSVVLAKPQAEVWAAITDFGATPQWFADIKSSERIADINGHPAWRENFGGFTADTLRALHRSAYHRGNIVVAAVGSVSHEQIVEQAARLLETLPAGTHRPNGRTAPPEQVVVRQIERASAQAHIVLGTRTFGHQDSRRIGLVLLSNAFGGGMSSRLFQRVREELGLAYAVYSLQSFYRDAGVSSIYVGTRPEWADRAHAVIRDEMAQLARAGLSAAELEDAKGQVRGQVVLSMESSGARLSRLAGTELYDEPLRSVEEVLALVDAVTQDDVAALAAMYFDPDRQVVLRLGPGGSRN